MKKYHVISNVMFILFCLLTGPISYSLRWVKKSVHLASMCHVHFKRNKSFISLVKPSPPSTARSPVLSFISPQLLFNPLSPSIQSQTLQTDFHTFPARIGSENLIADQSFSHQVIILLILTTFFLIYVLILSGENWLWSLLGLKGLKLMGTKNFYTNK